MYAIVPAHNEAPTVGGVVRVLLEADVFDDVIVVDDGSSDDTAQIAETAGATVIRTPTNLGKGGAMRLGYDTVLARGATDPNRIAFFDSDLLTLTPEHVRALAELSERGYDMVSLTQDRKTLFGYLQNRISPLISGQRIVRRWVLDALPSDCWCGYCIELAMNDVVARHSGKSARLVMAGVKQRFKLDKVGVLESVKQQWKMAKQIASTRRALARSKGRSCAT